MNISTPSMQDLLSAGVHFGHKISRGHPKMKQYIYGARDGVHIIDLAFSEEKLKEATQEAYRLGKEGKVLLIVGTKKQAQEIVEKLAKEANTFYLNKRWIGGLFTNFEEVRKNVKKLSDVKTSQEKGELSKYTKKEQLLISRKLEKFTSELGGAATMEKLPDAVFFVDAVSDKTGVVEANKVGIEVLGLCDTNADPFWFDFPVPANDDGIKSINLICETVLGAYIKGRKESGAKTEAPKAEELKKENSNNIKKSKSNDSAEKSKSAEEGKSELSEKLDAPIAEEAAALEEEIEKVVLDESERKVE